MNPLSLGEIIFRCILFLGTFVAAWMLVNLIHFAWG